MNDHWIDEFAVSAGALINRILAKVQHLLKSTNYFPSLLYRYSGLPQDNDIIPGAMPAMFIRINLFSMQYSGCLCKNI